MKVWNDICQLRYFLFLWIGQFFSQLGSSMTGFALSIWAYQKTGSALVLSISGLFILLPRMVGSLFAGPFVDRMDKKKVMLFTDISAGLCTLVLLFLMSTEQLAIWHIYCINFLASICGSFQQPANSVAVSLIVPKEYYIKTSGLSSFSDGMVQILSPVFASALLGFSGMTGVITFDLISMGFACLTLLTLVKIPENRKTGGESFRFSTYCTEIKQGFVVIQKSKLLTMFVFYYAFLNFVSGITYYNLITPMILARSGNNAHILAVVNASIGLGGIVGGLLLAVLPAAKSKIKVIFLCTVLSFLTGDVVLALGNSFPIWVAAGFLSSLFIPPISGNGTYFWRVIVPVEMQGRVFSCRYAFEATFNPLGLVVGGVLADYVFEPFMIGSDSFLVPLVGNTAGSGMALIFLITGVLGIGVGLVGFCSRRLTDLEKDVPNY